MPQSMLPTVQVGPAQVLDATAGEVTNAIAALCAPPQSRVSTAYALHVGGVNLITRGHQGYIAGLRAADIVYADGAATVLLAKAGGATRIERAPTTDIGRPILGAMAALLARNVRVALIGGPEGLADRAARVLEAGPGVEVVYTTHGFRTDDETVADELRAADADVLVVGMGAPIEVDWVERMKPLLPAVVVLTSGGWFGFLAGDEKRAPRFMQKTGLEWAYRLSLTPRRLAARYAVGTWSTARLLVHQWATRRRSA